MRFSLMTCRQSSSPLLSLFFCAAVALCALGAATPLAPPPPLSVRAWQNVDTTVSTFPERELPEWRELAARTSNTAIALSGGGGRAYSAGLGQVAALQQLKLFERLRYMTGVSGGGWATLAVAYYQKAPGRSSDAEMLGALPNVSCLTLAALGAIPAACGRAAATRDFDEFLVKALLPFSGVPLNKCWQEAVARTFSDPLGIPRSRPFAYSAAAAAEIASRNPGIGAFVLPPSGSGVQKRPFPIVGTALLGPKLDAPFDRSNRSYTLLEVSPVAVGFAHTANVTYRASHDFKKDTVSAHKQS